MSNNNIKKSKPEILLISSYPPRECGIATFSDDLRKALNNKFSQSFSTSVCALETADEKHDYPAEVRYVLDTSNVQAYQAMIDAINSDDRIKIVLLQHEFGFFETMPERDFLHFLNSIKKPLIVTFHTVLSRPNDALKKKVSDITKACDSVVVMTKNSAKILENEYDVPSEKTWIIAHGIHLVPHLGRTLLKKKYGLNGRKVLSTFGLISSGKSIETTLDALPGIVADHPTIIFLIIGKTHPSVVKHEGEQYRRMLEAKVADLSLENNVKFINAYLPLQELLEYLQLTDIYLFTSKDPHQAVSGTFSYAVSCACAIISTPIPHAKELLRDDAGILIDFQNSPQLTAAVNHLLDDKPLRKRLISNGLQRVIFAAWENTAIAYAMLFKNLDADIVLRYGLPEIHLGHIKKMTTNFGMIQFSKINHPDNDSGYTIDDNARAMVAVCMHHEIFNGKKDLNYIQTYLNFIEHCLQPDGHFLNYVNIEKAFTTQNKEVNLDDANGRTIWALGLLISKHNTLPKYLVQQAKTILEQTFTHIETMHSPRAMAFAIKGLHYYLSAMPSPKAEHLVKTLANRLVQMYRHEAESGWHWFESYLTYGNSILPEALLCAWLSTGNYVYRDIAHESFDFLLKQTFTEAGIKVVPNNNGWMQKGQEKALYGEQPIDVAYTILALQLFYEVFNDERYKDKMQTAFNWFLGQNHLDQIIYNPCTGGCYDGLEETQVNMNQGAESTVSYLMARLAIQKSLENQKTEIYSVGIKRDVEKKQDMELMLQ